MSLLARAWRDCWIVHAFRERQACPCLLSVSSYRLHGASKRMAPPGECSAALAAFPVGAAQRGRVGGAGVQRLGALLGHCCFVVLVIPVVRPKRALCS